MQQRLTGPETKPSLIWQANGVPSARGAAEQLKNVVQHAAHGLGFHVSRLPIENTIENYLLRLFDALGVNCVLDVGAHFGEFYNLLRGIGYKGTIISFEPVPDSFRELCEAARGDARWRGVNVALGRERGMMRINIPDSTGFSSFLKPNEYCAERFPYAGWSGRGIDVRVDSLDEIYAGLVATVERPRVYLKIDTQGWDAEVIGGARNTLAEVVAFQSEVSVRPLYHGMRDFVSSITAYQELGFTLGAMFPVVYDASGLRAIEFDCVMLPKKDRPPKPPSH